MGLFDMDMSDVSDNPNCINPDKYPAVLTKFEIKDTATGKRGMTFYFTIESGPYAKFMEPEWKFFPPVTYGADGKIDGSVLTAYSYIKQRMLSLGIPADQVNDVQAEDLVGTKVWMTTKHNASKNGNKITNISPRDDADPFATGDYGTF